MVKRNHLLFCAVFCKLWPSRETFSTRSNSSVRTSNTACGLICITFLMLLKCVFIAFILFVSFNLIYALAIELHPTNVAICVLLFLSLRSSTPEEYVKTIGDIPVTFCKGIWAAGWRDLPDLAEFGKEPRRAMHSFTGLHQTTAGAKDAALPLARYSMDECMNMCFISWS